MDRKCVICGGLLGLTSEGTDLLKTPSVKVTPLQCPKCGAPVKADRKPRESDDKSTSPLLARLRKAAERLVNDPGAHFALAEALNEEGSVEAALREYFIVRALDPSHFQAWLKSAALHGARGDSDEALRCLEEAFGLNPDEPTVLRGLAEACASSGRVRKALDMLQRLKLVEPRDIKVYIAIEKLEKRLSLETETK